MLLRNSIKFQSYCRIGAISAFHSVIKGLFILANRSVIKGLYLLSSHSVIMGLHLLLNHSGMERLYSNVQSCCNKATVSDSQS